ncbi:MAG: GPW/gp25 family protein [Actinobacteria bacterium]|nr:GPW/gp25 family protein [Actinomycetota bacterium]
MAQQDFVGSGFDFPMDIDDQGGIRMVGGTDNIDRSIRLIMGTAYGERPMRPDFGCGIHDLLFDSTSLELLGQVQAQVVASLRRWETRADILDVSATYGDDPTVINIQVTYRVKGNYDPRNLLVPFYVIPREEDQ